jgi:hypothetical protein
MTPEEKAKELLWKFADGISENSITLVGRDIAAKQCALICVDEIIASRPQYPYTSGAWSRSEYVLKFWQSVKQAIINLK